MILCEQNKNLVVILILSVFVCTIITVVNSTIIQWGIFFYYTGLFIVPSGIYLDFKRGCLATSIIGLYVDSIFNTPFGFHGLILPLTLIISKKWINEYIVRNNSKIILIQTIFNSVFLFLLSMVLVIQEFNTLKLDRFLIDVSFSTILFIPVVIWQSDFMNLLLKDRLEIEVPIGE